VQKTAALLASGLLLAAVPISAQQEVIAAVQVHGNTLTADVDIIRTSGLTVGTVFSDSLLSDAEGRLRSAGRFDDVEVLKRYASISDPTQILVLIRVDEGPVRIESPRVPGPGGVPTVVRRRKVNVMFAPILDAEDGYGVTYGALFSIAGHRNATQRAIIPVSWGGDKRAALEFHKELPSRLVPRIRTGVLVQRRTHPFFDSDADRKRVWARAEWPFGRGIRVASEMAWQSSVLMDDEQRTKSIGAELTVDTRVDPVLPHHALYLRAAVGGLGFTETTVLKSELDATGYLGIFRGTVLAVRLLREDMSEPVPADFKSILGGSRNLRGFRAGDSIGDTLLAGSAEIRIPLTSPFGAAKFGSSVFIDAGTVYDKGQRLHEQKLKKGIGAGFWATAPLFHVNVMVAHGVGATTRVHFRAGLTF
jgi:outer membrane protein assembly factor BamA